jgi:hypothetical protein
LKKKRKEKKNSHIIRHYLAFYLTDHLNEPYTFMYHVFSYDKPFLRKTINLNVNAARVVELMLENGRVTDSDLTAAL